MAKAKATGIILHKEEATEKKDFSFKVLEELGVLGTRKGRGGKEQTVKFRYLQWGSNKPSYDIRLCETQGDGTEKGYKIGTFKVE